VCSCIYIQVCILMYVYMCVYVCVRVFVCVRACVHVRVCAYQISRKISEAMKDSLTACPRGTTPLLSMARTGNGGSLRMGLHHCGDRRSTCGHDSHSAQTRIVSLVSGRTRTSCCRCVWAGLMRCLIMKLLSWWVLDFRADQVFDNEAVVMVAVGLSFGLQ